jgi:hypothetical protein
MIAITEPIAQPPVVSAGPDITTTSTTVTLQGSGVDPRGSPLTFTWAQLSGPAQAVIASPANAVTQVTLSSIGTYVFRLSATDGSLTGSAIANVALVPSQCVAIPSGLVSYWPAEGMPTMW